MKKYFCVIIVTVLFSCSDNPEISQENVVNINHDTIKSRDTNSISKSSDNAMGEEICSGVADDLTSATYDSLVFDYDILIKMGEIKIQRENYYDNKNNSNDTIVTIECKNNIYKYYISKYNKFLLTADIKNKNIYNRYSQEIFFGSKNDIIKKSKIPCDRDLLKIFDGFHQVEIGYAFKNNVVSEIVIETNPD